MDQWQYHQRRRHYTGRGSVRASSYRSSFSQETQPLPYGVFFRFRLLLCLMLFMSFAYAEHRVLSEAQEKKIYQVLEENISGEKWKEYALEAFHGIRGE